MNKEIIQRKNDTPLQAYSMDKETTGQFSQLPLSQLPPSYSGYALVKIERVPEQLTMQFIETIIRSMNKKGGK